MKTVARLLSALMLPLAALNMLGGIVSGIWLVALGDWRPVVVGVVGLFFTHHILGFAFLPGAAFAIPGMHFLRRGNRPAAYISLFLSQLYTAAVITAWATLVMVLFVGRATPDTILPLLLFSYGVATGPLAYLAQQEQKSGGGEAAVVSTVAAEFAYIIAGVAVLLLPVTLFTVAAIIGTVMAATACILTAIAVAAMEAEARVHPGLSF